MLDDPSPRTPAQQLREHADPHESSLPVPRLVAAITLGAVLFGAAYIASSEAFGPPELGDRRTLADLAPAQGAAGHAVDGKQVFAAQCASCHQASGQGLPGVFPPLDGSEWVLGDARVLANILLHGVSGELVVKGQTYKGSMPSFKQLSDEELAALLSHVRGQWTNKAPPVAAALIQAERKASSRTAPFEGGQELQSLARMP